MDNELSRRVALSLIEARSVEDVQKILADAAAREWFDDPQHWTPYGNSDKNRDMVGKANPHFSQGRRRIPSPDRTA
jgi:hypothetical protein